MSHYRIETVRGRHLLCGGPIPERMIKNGQVWAAASGSGIEVKISAVRDGWVGYTWRENDKAQYHEKDSFSFQCRYCLVLDTPDVPDELAQGTV